MDCYVYPCRAFLFSLHSKQFPLLGPVLGKAFAELGKGDGCGFFAVEDGFDDVRSEVDKAQCPQKESAFLFLGKIQAGRDFVERPSPPGTVSLDRPGGHNYSSKAE